MPAPSSVLRGLRPPGTPVSGIFSCFPQPSPTPLLLQAAPASLLPLFPPPLQGWSALTALPARVHRVRHCPSTPCSWPVPGGLHLAAPWPGLGGIGSFEEVTASFSEGPSRARVSLPPSPTHLLPLPCWLWPPPHPLMSRPRALSPPSLALNAIRMPTTTTSGPRACRLGLTRAPHSRPLCGAINAPCLPDVFLKGGPCRGPASLSQEPVSLHDLPCDPRGIGRARRSLTPLQPL